MSGSSSSGRRDPAPAQDPRRDLLFGLLFGGLLLALAPATSAAVDDKPLLLTGGSLPQLAGRPVDEIYLLRFDGAAWSGIPHQIDERETVLLATCLDDPRCQTDPERSNCDEHSSYVFDGWEGGAGAGLDGDDEIVFLAGDVRGGLPAGLGAWPPTADAERFEIEVRHAGETLGFVYLFTGPPGSGPLLPPPTDYVDLDYRPGADPLSEDTTVAGDGCAFHLRGFWLLDGLFVPTAGGGSGTDFLDRLKRREAATDDAHFGENEELWSQTSCLLGHKDGPVRVIREIQGAASGVNTTKTEYYYRSHLTERVNLRVHPIPNLFSFVDYHSQVTPLTYYNPANPAGVAIDGVPDPGIVATLGDWELVTHPQHGGVFYHYRQPVPPPAQSQQMFYDDDSTDVLDPEEEPGRYGCHGIRLDLIDDTDTPGSEAVFVNNVVCLPAGTGDVGASLAAEIEQPPVALIRAQSRCGGPACPSHADLTILKDDGRAEAHPGEILTYSIVAANAGPDDVVGALVGDTFDPALFDIGQVSWLCAPDPGAGAGTTCPAAGDADDLAAGVPVGIESGDSVAFTVTAPVSSSATAEIVNTATVTPPADVFDPDPGSNSATDRTLNLAPGPCGYPVARDLRDRTISSTEVFTACEWISVGPDFVVASGGVAILRAGVNVTLNSGTSTQTEGEVEIWLDPSLAPAAAR